MDTHVKASEVTFFVEAFSILSLISYLQMEIGSLCCNQGQIMAPAIAEKVTKDIFVN